uniref:DNA-directed DNA polymerase n=1 Tax=viral metagenome TaxID=1070528 RepID=A0A6C0CH63_9ZZZZ
MLLQPCDWLECDSKERKYIVDVFGRLDDDRVAKIRLTGFHPYFYLRSEEGETKDAMYTSIGSMMSKEGKFLSGMKITQEMKLDAMRGFSGLSPIKVWKLTFNGLIMMKMVVKALKSAKLGKREIVLEDIYEANLPPYIRLFHEMDISPASPISFDAEEEEPEEDENVDVCFTVPYDEIEPDASRNVPLYIAGYDIETYSESGNFPVASNPSDEIIQIGVSFRYTDDLLSSYKRFVFVSGTCSPSKDDTVTFVSCRDEKHLLEEFMKCVRFENPDIIAGYNTFGFDDSYIADRCAYNRLIFNIGRVEIDDWRNRGSVTYAHTEAKKFELASGTFAVRYLKVPGRLAIDLLLSVRREQNLDSYKLDSVANTFLRDKVTKVVIITGEKTQMYEIFTKTTRGLFNGNLVRFDIMTNTTNPYRDGKKFYVSEVKSKSFIVDTGNDTLFDDLSADEMTKLEWSFSKDDTSAQEMFASHRGSADDRAVIAKYCIQDCDLVLTLMAKLDTIVNARGMADVCRVPIQYIFLRGQGIKIYSAVVYQASKRNQIIMTQEGIEGDTSYEGAIVLPPKIGMYLDQPIPVLDFNSLYPSNMIAYNLSPDTLVYVKTFSSTGKKLKQEGPDGADLVAKGFKIDEVSYDTFDEEKKPSGRITCGFVQPNDDPRTVGVLPLTLDILLKKRKETRKLIEKTDDDAQKSVLNGLQLAYKVVANSVYGQCGSRTSPIRRLEVAACTTAVGRQKIYDAKKIVETEFGGEVIYGDTDSIFIKFATKDLAESIELGKKAAERITASGRKAHKIEYEKTFYPFIIFCRKRYVGMMYEDDITKCKRKTMGVALKRRDNAPIVKDVFGGALDSLMEHRNIKVAEKLVKDMLVKVMKNEYPLEKFILSKQLRDDYKNPGQIAHRVLADRMEERDAGNKPQVGDRLSYVYVANRHDEKKQGDKIESVDYVREKKLKPDVDFYITNQIQNPVAQLFALAIEDLEGYKKRDYDTFFNEYRETLDEEEATLKVLKLKERDLDSLLFMGAQYLKKHKRGPMDMFLKR